ncbi:uncharacterized protein LOC132718445 [Ruditapes philippinarum]|uniref:uncharacterized protein LOC132718445 n=1 Tax=Ruditapes philippinarum TaxID=129788 RepID=UPI00295A8EC0|nr:uncharacterized protein LOC132718445 [Ruditapes philippinarum]
MNEVNANKSVKCQDGFFEVTDKNSEKYATCSQFGRWSFVPQCEECPKDGEVIRGFQFFSKKMTHQRASMFCSKRNASLVKIRETGKFMYIRSIIKTCNYKQLWTDGKKIDDVWIYSDDHVVPQNDTYWNRYFHNNGMCLRIHHRFRGKSCNALLGYICEFL